MKMVAAPASEVQRDFRKRATMQEVQNNYHLCITLHLHKPSDAGMHWAYAD
jgi:hypothetical protein